MYVSLNLVNSHNMAIDVYAPEVARHYASGILRMVDN